MILCCCLIRQANFQRMHCPVIQNFHSCDTSMNSIITQAVTAYCENEFGVKNIIAFAHMIIQMLGFMSQ